MDPSLGDVSVDSLVTEFGGNIKGKTVLTTGVTLGGLGAYFVEAIVKASPNLLILAGRSTSKAEATAAKIQEMAPDVATRVLRLDLASFRSCEEAAAEVNAYPEAIDVVVNNAGVAALAYAQTEDGLESDFQANHLGHFLFTNLIMEKVLASGHGRVVNVSSDAYRFGHVRYYDYNFHDGESFNPWCAYGASKTANILFSRELARRLGGRGLTAYSANPGLIRTPIMTQLENDDFESLKKHDQQLGMSYGWSDLEVQEPQQGVAVYTFAAFAPPLNGHNGAFLQDLQTIPTPDENIHPWALGDLEARKCWRLSETLVGEKFNY